MNEPVELVGGPLDGSRLSVPTNKSAVEKGMYPPERWFRYEDSGQRTGEGLRRFVYAGRVALAR